MNNKYSSSRAFTLIELLVVISIIAILALLAGPALTQALTKGQMTGTLNNARQFYLASFQMATDGSANSNPAYTWPGDDASITSLEGHCNKLVQNDYLKPGDIQKILNAPGATCNVTTVPGPPVSVTLAGKSGLKVYKVKEVDSSSTIFSVSANYSYNAALDPTKIPYGDKGFVVMRKGGDAGAYRKNEATQGGWNNDFNKFAAAIGRLPGDSTDDTASSLTNPQ